MKSKSISLFVRVPVFILAALVSACDLMGPGEGEFVQACLQEGQRGVNKRMSDEMGVDRETMCKCAASEARASLSPDGYRAMILDMQGNAPAAREITSKMNDSEKMAMLQGTLEVFGKCAGMKP